MSGPVVSDPVKVSRDGRVTRLLIDRAEKLNALSAAMMDALAAAVESAETPVLLLSGAGEKSFCAGADIAEFATGPAALAAQEKALLRLISALARTPCLTLVQAHGRVMGAGGLLAALADATMMRADSHIGFPEIRFGMFPIIVHAVLLERMSPALAWQLCATGRMLGAEECLRLGMAAHILPPEDFPAAAARQAAWYAERADSFALMRPAVRVVSAERLERRLRETAPLMLRNYALPGVAAAIRAVLPPKA